MARQGKRLTHAFRLPLVGVFLAVLFLSVSGWCACTYSPLSVGFRVCGMHAGYCHACPSNGSCSSYEYSCRVDSDFSSCPTSCQNTSTIVCGELITDGVDFSGVPDRGSTIVSFQQERWICDSCGVDSLSCRLQGGRWEPSSDPDSCGKCISAECEDRQTQCEANGGSWVTDPTDDECGHKCDTTDVCSEYRQQCAQLGGEFTGTKLGDGCSATCNTCGTEAQKRILDIKISSCCNQQLAPEVEKMCYTPLQQGIGMSTSTNADLSCVDPNLDDENMSAYAQYCGTGSSSSQSEGSSSSGEGSSSSGDGSSSDSQGVSSDSQGSSSSQCTGDGCGSSAYYSSGSNNNTDEGEDLYGVLDTIRDSTSKIKHTIVDIYTCLTTRGACGGLNFPSDSNYIKKLADHIDTAFIKYLQPLMDTSIKLDSFQWKALLKLDTNDLKMMARDSARNYRDSVYQWGVVGGFYTNDTNFRKLRKLIDSIGDGTAFDNDTIIDELRNIKANLQYGDCTIVDRLGDIYGALDGLGEGLGTDIAGALDSAWGNGTALGESGYGGYGTDSSSYGSILQDAEGSGTGAADSSYDIEGDTCTTVDCIVAKTDVDSMGQAFRDGLDSNYKMIEDSSATWFDSLRQNLKFVDFDSVLIAPLENIVPNLNVCPEECFKGQITTVKGIKPTEFDYGVCKNWTIGGINVNALLVVRLILRILTAVCCIYIGLWYIAGRK